eukprot:384002_1
MALAGGLAAAGGLQHVQQHPVQDAMLTFGAMKLTNQCIINPISKGVIAGLELAVDTVLSPMASVQEKHFRANVKTIIKQYEDQCLKRHVQHNHICPSAEDAQNVAKEIEIEFAGVYKDHLSAIFLQNNDLGQKYGGIYKDPFKSAKDAYVQMRRKSAANVPYDEIAVFEHVNNYVCHMFDLLSTWFRLQQPEPMWHQNPITFAFDTQEQCEALWKMNNQQHYHFTTDPVFLRDALQLPVKGVAISQKCKLLKLVWWRFMDKFDDLATEVDDNNVINTWILHKLGWQHSGCTGITTKNIKRAFSEATCEDMDHIAAAYNKDKLLEWVNKKAKKWFQVKGLRHPIEGECAQKLSELWGIYRQRMSDLVPWAEDAHQKREEEYGKRKGKHDHHMHVDEGAEPKSKKKRMFNIKRRTPRKPKVHRKDKKDWERLKEKQKAETLKEKQKAESLKEKQKAEPKEKPAETGMHRGKREKSKDWKLRQNAQAAASVLDDDDDMSIDHLYYVDDPLYSQYEANYIANGVDPWRSLLGLDNILVVLCIAMTLMFVICGAIGCGVSYMIKRKKGYWKDMVVRSNDESV